MEFLGNLASFTGSFSSHVIVLYVVVCRWLAANGTLFSALLYLSVSFQKSYVFFFFKLCSSINSCNKMLRFICWLDQDGF
jgi:hypothetical protein